MVNTIQGRILLGYLLFLILLASGMAMTYYVTERQIDDGLIVNLAGRQRMLTQKMTKETLILAQKATSRSSKGIERLSGEIKLTMKVFESTLFALRDGGPAPINLEMTQFRQSPPTETEETLKQLQKVSTLWKVFKAKIVNVLKSRGKSSKSLEYIIQNNTILLKEMNLAVSMMQENSEEKVRQLILLQGGVVLIGFLLIITGVFIVKFSIVDPILRLISAADNITKGNIKDEISEKGTREIEHLGVSFNRLRISLQKMMERYAKAKM